jgi:hypothetical protein
MLLYLFQSRSSNRFRRTTPLLLFGEFGEIPAEVDHDLANLALPAYRLSEAGETPGSTSPAKRSQ